MRASKEPFIGIRQAALSLLLLVAALAASGSPAFSGIAAPSPVYRLEGKVLTVAQKTRPESGRSAPGKEKTFTYYEVTLKISSMAVVSDPRGGGSRACTADEIRGAEKWIFIPLTENSAPSPVKPGQHIRALSEFRGDEWFHGNFLSDIVILPK